jgi:hypothetical protein
MAENYRFSNVILQYCEVLHGGDSSFAVIRKKLVQNSWRLMEKARTGYSKDGKWRIIKVGSVPIDGKNTILSGESCRR